MSWHHLEPEEVQKVILQKWGQKASSGQNKETEQSYVTGFRGQYY